MDVDANIELKFLDDDMVGGVIPNSVPFESSGEGGIVNSNRGSGQSQREGRHILITNIRVRFRYHLPRNATDVSWVDSVRFMVILDKQANGASPLISDVLDFQSGAVAYIHAFPKLSNGDRFQILHQQWDDFATQSLDAFGETGAIFQIVDFEMDCNIPIDYDGNTGGVSDITSNNIIVWMISASQDIQLHSGVTRVRFLDM